jgi:hypothetical protein
MCHSVVSFVWMSFRYVLIWASFCKAFLYWVSFCYVLLDRALFCWVLFSWVSFCWLSLYYNHNTSKYHFAECHSVEWYHSPALVSVVLLNVILQNVAVPLKYIISYHLIIDKLLLERQKLGQFFNTRREGAWITCSTCITEKQHSFKFKTLSNCK